MGRRRPRRRTAPATSWPVALLGAGGAGGGLRAGSVGASGILGRPGAGVGDDDLPLVARRQEIAHRRLRRLQGVVGAPAALHLIGGGHLVGAQDVVEGRLQQRQELGRLQPQGQGVEAGLAAHGPEVDEPVGAVAHELGGQVLDGVHRPHIQVLAVGLAEAHVVLDQLVAARQALAVGDPHEGRGHPRVVEVEGLDVHTRSRGLRVLAHDPKAIGAAAPRGARAVDAGRAYARHVPKGNSEVKEPPVSDLARIVVGPDDAPALVLLHGITSSALSQADAIDHWAARGYRVVAVDARGHGLSPRWTPAELERAGQVLVDDVVAVLEDLDVERRGRAALGLGAPPPPVLIGHSMGAATAMVVGTRRPGLVRGLVLIDPARYGARTPHHIRQTQLPQPRPIAERVAQMVLSS